MVWVTQISSCGLQPLYVLHMMNESRCQTLPCLGIGLRHQPWQINTFVFEEGSLFCHLIQVLTGFGCNFRKFSFWSCSGFSVRSWQMQWSVLILVHHVFKMWLHLWTDLSQYNICCFFFFFNSVDGLFVYHQLEVAWKCCFSSISMLLRLFQKPLLGTGLLFRGRTWLQSCVAGGRMMRGSAHFRQC